MDWSGALYFPFMRVRDDAWLKATALYWDTLYRFRPYGYVLRDSADARELADAGYLRPLNPGRDASDVAEDLLTLMRADSEALHQRYNVYSALPEATHASRHDGPIEGDPALGWIHVEKIAPQFAEFLTNAGLARPSRDGDKRWLGLHPTVAAAYMVALTTASARANHLTPATDQSDFRLSPTSGVEGAMRLLTHGLPELGTQSTPDASPSFAMLAIEKVLPRGLADAPVQRVLATKQKLAQELAAFRKFVGDAEAELEHLATVRDREVRLHAFAAYVENKVTGPIEQLERGLRLLGWRTFRSLFTTQTVTPPALFVGAAKSGSCSARRRGKWRRRPNRGKRLVAVAGKTSADDHEFASWIPRKRQEGNDSTFGSPASSTNAPTRLLTLTCHVVLPIAY